MMANYFKIAWRHLVKNRQFTFLNVLGLSAGLACALLIYLWVKDESSYDKFFAKNDQIYQLMVTRTSEGLEGTSDESYGLLADAVKAKMPEVEYAASVAPPEWWQLFTLSVGDKNIKASGQYVGPDYFNIFSFGLLKGDKGKVLSDKSFIVISDELAIKLFGTTNDIIGKAVHFQHEKDFFVSGVFEKPPVHSSIQFDFVLSFEYLKDVQPWVNSWNNSGPHNFVLLKKGTDITSFNKKIDGFVTANNGDSSKHLYAALFSANYLANTYDHGNRVGSKIEYVRMFSLIAMFILVIACINFMNLSTAKSAHRMREVGIKKVAGASRMNLVIQFLTESILVTLLAMIFAIGIAWFLLPEFNQLTGKNIALVFDRELVGMLVLIVLVTGLVAGSYPAIYLSAFQPIKILKGKLPASFAELVSRKGLVVFQFSLSVTMIISVLIIYQQIQFIQSTDPGYNKDNLIRFNNEGRILGREEMVMAQLKKIPGVVNASITFNNVVGRNYGHYGISWEGKNPNADFYFEAFGVGYDFTETLGMEMAAGRSFSRDFGNDSTSVIFNESAIKVMNLKDPVGKTIKLFGEPRQIIGVVKNFHFESLHEQVKPTYMYMNSRNSPGNKIMVRIKSGKERETIARIEHFLTVYNPGFPFDYTFLSDAYQKQYQTETRVGIMSRYFAGLAILISCLGLFGLATFTAERRQKEIGIRKVVGASVQQITGLLSADFLKLVLIAVVIAFPVAWWSMDQWLQGFAYRINIGAGVFLIAGFSVVLITLLTISTQSIKAALANPIKSLRTE